jgi:hypothetical protein
MKKQTADYADGADKILPIRVNPRNPRFILSPSRLERPQQLAGS